jgi:predicted deacylase
MNDGEIRAELDQVKKMQALLLHVSVGRLGALYHRLWMANAEIRGMLLVLERKGILTEDEWRSAIAENKAADAVDAVFDPRIRALQELVDRAERGEVSDVELAVEIDAEIAKLEAELDRDLGPDTSEEGGSDGSTR